MFWGLILKANKKYTQTLEKSFHLSQASLDHATSDNEPVQVMYTQDDNSYLLCTLQKGKIFQCPLDLNFQEGDKLHFSTKGNGIVHLTGFLLPDDDFDQFGDMDEDDEDSLADESMEDLREKLTKAAKKKGDKPEANGKKKAAAPVESDEDEDDSDDELDASALQGSDDDEEGSDEEEDDSDMEEDEEEEDDSEDEAPAPPAKQQKLDPKAQQNGKKQKDQKKAGLENGDAKAQQKQKEKPASNDGKIQKLQGGLQIQDLKVGSGAEAKVGKKIQVYYEGRLKSNNKVFDATKNGPGFKMTLGRGEVIKGWDLGLSGMKVGGKRRLVCPPQLAYGNKGNPPVIPQNATLVFDIELKNVL